MAHSLTLVFQNSFYLAQERAPDPRVWESISNTVAMIKDMPGFRRYGQMRRSLFLSELQQAIDLVLDA